MTYKFAVNKLNYEDLSSGRVLYNAPGLTGFPVRLVDEIVQRCLYLYGPENSLKKNWSYMILAVEGLI